MKAFRAFHYTRGSILLLLTSAVLLWAPSSKGTTVEAMPALVPASEATSDATQELTSYSAEAPDNSAACGMEEGDGVSTLAQCIAACKNGEKAMEQFCRGIPDPRIRAGCWAVVLGSTTACIGWCYLQYS
jgi:hypothetical protein